MKAISIKQPWASWILRGAKLIENRTWATGYRGPLLIHASSRSDPEALYWVTHYLKLSQAVALRPGEAESEAYQTAIALGAVIGKVELVAIVTRSRDPWFEGPYGWVFARPEIFPRPIPFKGKLLLFDVPEELLS